MPIADEPKRRQYANTQNLFEQKTGENKNPWGGKIETTQTSDNLIR